MDDMTKQAVKKRLELGFVREQIKEVFGVSDKEIDSLTTKKKGRPKGSKNKKIDIE